jgi:hypothetical protein
VNWLGGVDGLRSVPMTLADHGWPVVRGTYRNGAGWRGLPGWTNLRAVDEDWSPDRNQRGYQWVPGLSPDRLGWRLPELKPVYQVIVSTVTTAAGRPAGRAGAKVGWV